MQKEVSIVIAGNKYILATPDLKTFQTFIDTVKLQRPDPISELVACAEKLPESVREKFYHDHLNEAYEKSKKRGTVSDEDFQNYVMTPEGMKHQFSILFKKHHPHLSPDQVYDIVLAGIEEHGADVFADVVASGFKVPRKEGDVETDFFRGTRTNRKSKPGPANSVIAPVGANGSR